MIAGIFHEGSGLGNQLFRYVATRVCALDRGYDFGMLNTEGFKGKDFLKLDMGVDIPGAFGVTSSGEVIPATSLARWNEKKVSENGVDIRGYDPEINFITDDTIIDGEFQDERYFSHRLGEVNEWLASEFIGMPRNLCVIGFRGGEYRAFPELFLPQSYWHKGMAIMREKEIDMHFVAVTDDPDTARAYLPLEVQIKHEMSTDWRMIRNASYLILANSSFFILPALLNRHAKHIIAPRYWGRHNTGVWSLPQNFYRKFNYI